MAHDAALTREEILNETRRLRPLMPRDWNRSMEAWVEQGLLTAQLRKDRSYCIAMRLFARCSVTTSAF